MAAPQVPPRPSRSQHQEAPSISAPDMPRIPPRPARKVDRSVSPHRDSFARSPLNDPAFLHNGHHNGSFHKSNGNNSSPDLPRRPPSVSLPSIGQEGMEYAHFDENAEDNNTSPQQVKNVGGDLPLFAPKASLPTSTAKSRIATVTRTDSSQAAAAGFGKPGSEAGDDQDLDLRKLRSRSSFSRPHSTAGSERATSTRPASIHDDHEHGIPEIGLQVPMYPNAGDVQAPSPSPYRQGGTPGVGFFNDGNNTPGSRNHSRKKSGREVFIGPPGSYGLHGHGTIGDDLFEKKWYEKHPEALVREKGEYAPGLSPRPEWALSSDDLNKLVHGNPTDVGMSTSAKVISTPSEDIGYLASEEYAARKSTPRATPASGVRPRTSGSQTHAESPLRKMSFPFHEVSADQDKAVSDEEHEVIHVDPPSSRGSKIHGGGYDPPTIDLGIHGGNTEEEGGIINERGYGVPILASDEVAKHPEREYLQPAVSPEQERHGEDYYNMDSDRLPLYQSGRRTSRPNSRPSSRPTSIHGMSGLSRFVSNEEHHEGTGTPLEEIQEYEPLFPDDEKEVKKPVTQVDRLKRPEALKHRFPSRDIWEDSPESVHYTTTVETPEPDEKKEEEYYEDPMRRPASKVFEPPEAELDRKEHLDPNDRAHYLTQATKEFAKPSFKPGVLAEVPARPGMKQRFPSRDIWEDSPDSVYITTTVETPQMEEDKSPEDLAPPASSISEALDKPQIPPRPSRKEGEPAADDSKPSVPARPQQKLQQIPPFEKPVGTSSKETSPTDKKAPVLPDRPKPQIPPRPRKEASAEEGAPLEKTTSASSATSDVKSPPETKAKPAVPARPMGGKLAALQANFMNDLNKKLGLGPQAPQKPKEEETEKVEEEKAPLVDARKSRARGPQRRRPGTSPGAAVSEAKEEPKKVSFSTTISTVWSFDGDSVVVPHVAKGAAPAVETSESTEPAETAEAATETGPTSVGGAVTSAISSVLPESLKPEESSKSEDQSLEEKTTSTSEDKAVQTGETTLEISDPKGHADKVTAYLGGKAPEEGNVVVDKDGKELGTDETVEGENRTSKGVDMTA